MFLVFVFLLFCFFPNTRTVTKAKYYWTLDLHFLSHLVTQISTENGGGVEGDWDDKGQRYRDTFLLCFCFVSFLRLKSLRERNIKKSQVLKLGSTFCYTLFFTRYVMQSLLHSCSWSVASIHNIMSDDTNELLTGDTKGWWLLHYFITFFTLTMTTHV